VKDLVPDADVKNITSDFEKAAWKAVKTVLPRNQANRMCFPLDSGFVEEGNQSTCVCDYENKLIYD
jgi:hypothetical protein